jgi:uncharacterized protein YfaP (DUF2135 family)
VQGCVDESQAAIAQAMAMIGKSAQSPPGVDVPGPVGGWVVRS